MGDILMWLFAYGVALFFILQFLKACHTDDCEEINHLEEKE